MRDKVSYIFQSDGGVELLTAPDHGIIEISGSIQISTRGEGGLKRANCSHPLYPHWQRCVFAPPLITRRKIGWQAGARQ